MQLGSMKKFQQAIESANITVWEAVTDIPTHMYNNGNQFNIIDEEEEILYNFSPAIGSASPYTGDVVVKGTDLGDIHEVRFSGSIEQVKKFIEAYGLETTSDQLKILANIQGANYNLIPPTGDYNVFKVLSDEELEKLSEKDREKYEASFNEYKKSKNRLQRAVQVNI